MAHAHEPSHAQVTLQSRARMWAHTHTAPKRAEPRDMRLDQQLETLPSCW